jgi:putative DNA methylase
VRGTLRPDQLRFTISDGAALPAVQGATTAQRVRARTYRSVVNSLESHFDETLVAGLAAAEKQVQQNYRPIIGVHKWFARRPGTLFRGLALAELVHQPLAEHYFGAHDLSGVVLDPFMGGGTTLFEANRIGLSVVGYDTNPMSRWLVERELEDLDVEAFEQEGERIAAVVEHELRGLYTTRCEECHGEAHVKFFLWVKTHECECGLETVLFPGSLVAGRKMGRHTHDVVICGSCRAVDQFLPTETPKACATCGALYSATKVLAKGECCCGRPFVVGHPTTQGPPKHTLFALEYHCERCKHRKGRRGRFFKGADADDHARFVRAQQRFAAMESPHWPNDAIPAGDETNRLLRWGYRRFRDLHNERQLLGLGVLADHIRNAPIELRPALATVYSDFIRYQNMVCRYDTAALKVLDVFSVHGFPVHRVQCEAALIGAPRVGSGGYRHFLAKYAAAKRYCREPFETMEVNGRKKKVYVSGERICTRVIADSGELDQKRSALLRCASMSVDGLPEASVDMVLTDPPYVANVQYSELMDFCYAWLRQLMPETPFFHGRSSKSGDEVTGNVTGGRGIDAFAGSLSEVYRAATHALRPGSPFVFTYHHNDLHSYAALIVAVLDAGLVPITTIVCPSEMRGSIHINKADSSRVDTVFVLRKPPTTVAGDIKAPVNERLTSHVENLVAAGLNVTSGDRRCIRHGLLAEDAIRELASDWDRGGPIAGKIAAACEKLGELSSAAGVDAPQPIEAIGG